MFIFKKFTTSMDPVQAVLMLARMPACRSAPGALDHVVQTCIRPKFLAPMLSHARTCNACTGASSYVGGALQHWLALSKLLMSNQHSYPNSADIM